MTDPQSALYHFLDTTVRTVKFVSRVDYLQDEDGRPFKEYEYDYKYTPEQYVELFDLFDKVHERQNWTQQAVQSIFVAEKKKELLSGKRLTYENKMVAITLCPPPEDSNPAELQKIILYITSISKKSIAKWFYTFEQRSIIGEEEHGWHLHLSVDTTYAPSKIHQFLKQKLESKGYKYIWKVALVCTHDDGKFREEYMKGIKNHKDKDCKVEQDLLLRQRYNLQNYYLIE